MSVANPNYGYYKGIIGIKQWNFWGLAAYRFVKIKKLDLTGQLGSGFFEIKNREDSYDIRSENITISPALQINYRLNN